MTRAKHTKDMEIESMIEKLGLQPKARHEGHPVRFNYVTNPDGSVRWFWPATNKRPLFLKFYYIQGWKASAFARLTRIFFRLHLQRLLFKSVSIRVQFNTNSLLSPGAAWAVFTGTPGPNRKAIVYTCDAQGSSFIKVALGEQSIHALRNEAAILQPLHAAKHDSYEVPAPMAFAAGSIQVSDLAGRGRRSFAFTDVHERALLEIRCETQVPALLKHLRIWKETKEKMAQLAVSADPRLPKGLLEKLAQLISSTNENQVIQVGLSHGDFTPWNMYVNAAGKLALYDWELARHEMPFGFDAFHFIVQQGILVNRNSWTEINQTIRQSLFGPKALLGVYPAKKQQQYLALYLIINTVYYLTLYRKQNVWHQQVTWLLNTWNVAVSQLLAAHMNHRQLVLRDAIDFLNRREYAMLKFHEQKLQAISESSDVDLCITKDDYRALSTFLKAHPLVKRTRITRKSFMAAVHLILQDDTLLSLDCIWKFKRKHLQVLDVPTLLKSSYFNRHGIRIARSIDNARFVGWFYSLNHAVIPEKYRAYRDALATAPEYADQQLREYYNGHANARALKKWVASRPDNTGLRGIVNRIQYGMDSLKEFVSGRGLVLTFSGVDGAGKSTIIENLKGQIEKKLRKRVVVIRHRPSVLPILSAWTKGKVRAEQEAAATLPRQGSNKSTLSSCLRFAYYYTDYLLGQWYIMLRYVLRGYVVLYDRYYFDFINDSKRSNIQLPESITRFGYTFIKEPDFNFFLFAQPDIILARKRELEKTTIEELTTRYLHLFGRLDKNNAVSRYIPIENLELNTTLKQIMDKVVARLAA